MRAKWVIVKYFCPRGQAFYPSLPPCGQTWFFRKPPSPCSVHMVYGCPLRTNYVDRMWGIFNPLLLIYMIIIFSMISFAKRYILSFWIELFYGRINQKFRLDFTISPTNVESFQNSEFATSLSEMLHSIGCVHLLIALSKGT